MKQVNYVVAGTTTLTADDFTNDGPREDVYFLCDSTAGVILIELPEISTLAFLNSRIYICDIAGLAGRNNISVSVGGSDTANGVTDNLVLSQAKGCLKIQPVSSTNWSSFQAGPGSSSTFIKIGTIDFNDVNGGGAAPTFTSTFAKGKPLGMLAKNFFTKVTTAFASVTRLPHLLSVEEVINATGDEVDFGTADRIISGPISNTPNIVTATDEGDILVTLAFGNAANNPLDYSAGEVEIYGEFALFPELG